MCKIRLRASKFVCTIFLKRTLCLICRVPFVNRWRLSMRLPKCQPNSDLSLWKFGNFQHPNWRSGILETRFYYYQVKLFFE
jgi:hypothetical protein